EGVTVGPWVMWVAVGMGCPARLRSDTFTCTAPEARRGTATSRFAACCTAFAGGAATTISFRGSTAAVMPELRTATPTSAQEYAIFRTVTPVSTRTKAFRN